jgi:hypothetical protein
MVFTVLANIVLCPFSHTLVISGTSLYVLVQDVSKQILWYCQLSLVLILPTLPLKPVIESTTIDLPVKKYPAEYGW